MLLKGDIPVSGSQSNEMKHSVPLRLRELFVMQFAELFHPPV